MTNYCFIPVPDNKTFHRVAKVYENVNGYFPLGKSNKEDPNELDKFIGRYDEVKFICDMWNKRLNLSEDQIDKIVLTSFSAEEEESNG
tara:strand:- start:457 stop:720 length:264 start_codon:yes stop_codon:yes gene_type:complete